MNDNLIITIGRQIGAGGLETARSLSREFGIKLLDKELLLEAAKQYGLDPKIFEKSDEKASQGRLGALSSFRSLLGGGSAHTATNSIMTEEGLFQAQSDALKVIAEKESCIIVGRCADYILRDHPRMASVFISADMTSRVHRMSTSHGWSEDEAQRFIEQGDKKRAEYYNYYTFKKWGDASSYDLCIDSSRLGDDISKVVEVIKQYLKLRNLI